MAMTDLERTEAIDGALSTIRNCFVTDAEQDSDGENYANVVDGLFSIARALERLADVVERRPK